MTQTLITRLSKLDAPDREVDAEIDVLFFGGETVWKTANYTMERFPASKRASKNHIGGYAYEYVPAYTASVDAAIALVERVLPGWWIQHMGQCTSGWKVRIETQGKSIPEGMKFDYAPSPAIALLIALLRAKEASQ